MTRILAPILLLVLLFPSFAFGETMRYLVKRDGLYYKKFTHVPFTGKVRGRLWVTDKRRGYLETVRKSVFGSVTGITDSYIGKQTTRTHLRTVLRSFTMTMVRYGYRELTRNGRERVLGSVTGITDS